MEKQVKEAELNKAGGASGESKKKEKRSGGTKREKKGEILNMQGKERLGERKVARVGRTRG